MQKRQNIFNRISIATKIAGSIIKSQTVGTFNNQSVGNYINSLSDINKIIAGEGVAYQTSCYNLCPPLQSVIAKKSQSIINANIIPVDSKGVTIEKSQAFDKVMKLLQKPNVYQTQSEFIRTIETLISVYGTCYIFKVIPAGFNDISGLICIPNNAITINYVSIGDLLSNNGDIVESYTITLYGKSVKLDGKFKDLIFQIKDNTINLTQGREFRPYSKIDGLKYPISNIVASLESRNQIIVKRGADVLLSPESSVEKAVSMSTLTPKEKELLQNEYAKYGSLNGQWHALITNIPMKAQQITRNIQALGLFEGEDSDIRAILRAYNIPAPLFGLKDENKYNTYLEAKREMYEDGIIPDAKIICEAFDEIFNSTANGYSFYFDYSHLQCFQISEKTKADALKTQVEALKVAIDSQLMTIDEAKLNLNDYLS